MGIEPPLNSPGNSTGSVPGGAESGASTREIPAIDPDLARIVQAWPDLPPAIRAGILARAN